MLFEVFFYLLVLNFFNSIHQQLSPHPVVVNVLRCRGRGFAWFRPLDRRLSIAWVRLSSFLNFIFSACVGSLKDFIGFSFSFSFPLRSFLAFFFGLSATRGVSLGVKAGRPVGVLGSGSPTFGTAGSAARCLVGVFRISSAEYCPTFATTISGRGVGEDSSDMTGSSYSSCPSIWGVVSINTCGVSCGVTSGACWGVSAVASVLVDFSVFFLGGFFLGRPLSSFCPQFLK